MAKKFPEFLKDVNVISKLGDNPGSDDNLTPDQLKAKFDEAPSAIKEYLGDLVETLEELFNNAGGAISGGNMTGALNMNKYALSGLREPANESDATNKGYVDTLISEKSDLLSKKIDRQKIVAENVSVPAELFVEDETYEDYPCRASVPVVGVTEEMIPEVVFSVSSLANNYLAPVSECYNGGVYIYADKVPTSVISIPTIVCWRR